MSWSLQLFAAVCAFSLYLSVVGVSDTPRDERERYLLRLEQLFEAVGWEGGREEVRGLAVRGLLWEQLNQNRIPNDQKTVRRYDELTVDQDGAFKARVLVDSLSGGLECLALTGTADLSNLVLSIGDVSALEVSECSQGTAGATRVQEGRAKPHGIQINNGSNG